MTDPFSITVGVIGLLSSLTSVSIQLNELIRDFSEAENDIELLLRELTDLTSALPGLQEVQASSLLQDNLSRDLEGVLENCGRLAVKAEVYLRKSSNRKFRGLFWAFSGKKECRQMCRGLEAHKATLSITLNLCSV
jgi:STAND-like protein